MNTINVNEVLSGKTVNLTFPGLMVFKFNILSGALNRIFSELDIPFMSEPVLIILRELINNASKANAKRIFFKNNAINIDNEEEYTSAMNDFTNLLKYDFEDFSRQNQNTEYYIKIFFLRKKDELQIAVENNCVPTSAEQKKIEDRFVYFRSMASLESAFTDMRDNSEGSGLGILLSLMLLRRAGMTPEESLRVKFDKDTTRIIITIPLHLRAAEFTNTIRDNIITRIEGLPTLPEKISHLLSLFESDSISMQQISREIETEPGITAQILKMVYSAGYLNRFKNPSMFDAVKIIGLNVIRNLLLVSGSRNVLATRFHSKELENIWENSNRVSFFARRLCGGNRQLEDIAPVAGLLHELGRIVLISMEPTLIKQIDDLLGGERIRQSSVIEEIELGISHPEVGFLLAEKWNFPEALLQAIRFQQKPLQAPEKYRALIYNVYLAICIQEASKNRFDFHSVEPEVLLQYNISDENEYLKLVDSYSNAYEANQKELEDSNN